MTLPVARGPRSAAILEVLTQEGPPRPPADLGRRIQDAGPIVDPLTDDDLHLSLVVLYELHYRGIDGVDDRWEWQPDLLSVRSVLEDAFEFALRQESGTQPGPVDTDGTATVRTLEKMTAPTGKPGLAAYLARHGNDEQYREFLIHRSIYHLKEADPHTWAIPRLSGEAKAALVEIQADEYGGGRPEWVHAQLFAQSMTVFGLNTRYGHYLDQVPATTLATVNAMSLFGLHRRLRGALVGHLAAFEMTSTLPNRLYAQGLRRLGYPEAAAAYFDEHVEADAVHEQIASRDLAGGLVRAEPDLAEEIIFGAATALKLDDVAAAHLLRRWASEHSALYFQLPMQGAGPVLR